MASYTAARTKDAIIITMPLSAIVASIESDPGKLAVHRAEVLDIDLLADEIVQNINGSNAIEALIECEVGEAVSGGSKAIATSRVAA